MLFRSEGEGGRDVGVRVGAAVKFVLLEAGDGAAARASAEERGRGKRVRTIRRGRLDSGTCPPPSWHTLHMEGYELLVPCCNSGE